MGKHLITQEEVEQEVLRVYDMIVPELDGKPLAFAIGLTTFLLASIAGESVKNRNLSPSEKVEAINEFHEIFSKRLTESFDILKQDIIEEKEIDE